MKIRIIFPKKFFTANQLDELSQYDLKFFDGNDIDLDALDDLYDGSDDLIFSINPAYVKDEWISMPIERIEKMKRLKALVLSTTSFSWIDTKKLKDMGIVVTNAPGKSTNAVAEFNMYLMYALLRKLPLIIQNSWKLDYNDVLLTREAKGLTAGIIGLGAIGTRVAELAQGNGLRVIYWNRSKKESPYLSVSLETLLQTTDVVFCTLATPPEMKGFLKQDLIDLLKPTAFVITTSDTSVWDEAHLLELVKNGKLAGFAAESNDPEKQKKAQDNVIYFPEQAFYTKETQERTAQIVTDTILSILERKPINVINA